MNGCAARVAARESGDERVQSIKIPSCLPPSPEATAWQATTLDMTIGRNGTHLSFSKTRRLTRASEFELVRHKGRVQRGKFLFLSVLEAKEAKETASPFRAGFITSRALGRAVSRNRVRRRLREIVRKHQREIVSGVWLVTIARAAAASASYAQLEAEWLRLAGRASILAA